MNTTTKKIVLSLAVLAVVTTAAVLYFYFSSKKQSASEDNILFDGQVSGLSISEDTVYFISDNSLVLINLNDKSQDTVATFDDNVTEVNYSPDHRSAHIATSGDEYKNWIVDIDKKNKREIASCGAAFGWARENSGYVYNCVIQEEEYDPDTVNSLVNNRGAELASLNIDPPRKIWPISGEKILILTASPGYNANDLLVLDTAKGEYQNLTQNGFVRNAIINDDYSWAAYTYGKDQLHLGLLEIASREKVDAGLIDKFATIALHNNNLYVTRTNSDGLLSSIENIPLQSPEQRGVVYRAKTLEIRAEQIVPWGDNFIAATNTGLRLLPQQ